MLTYLGLAREKLPLLDRQSVADSLAPSSMRCNQLGNEAGLHIDETHFSTSSNISMRPKV